MWVKVASYGNFSADSITYTVSDLIVMNTTWDGAPQNDAALLKLDTSSTGLGWFALSQANDTAWAASTDFHRGYPGFSTRSCASNTKQRTSNSVLCLSRGLTDCSIDGSPMRKANGAFRDSLNGGANYDTSGASGLSGAPHFYCPNGSCSTTVNHQPTPYTVGALGR